MKLKKIASLALAGIMAVSMLAGCKDGGNSNSGSSSENTNTASGYSAMLGQKAAETLSDNDRDKIFTFADNDKDQKALSDAILEIGDSKLEDWVKNGYVVELDQKYASAYNSFKADAGLDRTTVVSNNDFFDGSNPANTKKVGVIWVANGTVSMDKVLDKIFSQYENAFKSAQKEGTIGAASSAVTYDFKYTVSVSVVNKPVTSNTQFNGSINFIAVTVTRTGTAA